MNTQRRGYIILTKSGKLWRSDYTKEKGFECLGVVNCGKVNVWGKLMVYKDYLVRVSYADSYQCPLSSPMPNVPSLGMEDKKGDTSTREIYALILDM